MLELRHVGFETDDNKEILRDVSLTVQERFVAITGPNGGGKSTLAKVIAGIYQPTSGQILLDGVDITHMSITDRANLGLSYAFQQPVRFKGLRVKDLLSLAAGKNTSVNEACSYLSEVGLCARDYVDRELNDSLSGGELKRIEIAMVLARGTKLSIFDEPEAGIDLWSFQNLIRVFEKMYEQTRGSILIISHQERILNIADKIVVIKNGQVEKEGARADILPALLGSVHGAGIIGLDDLACVDIQCLVDGTGIGEHQGRCGYSRQRKERHHCRSSPYHRHSSHNYLLYLSGAFPVGKHPCLIYSSDSAFCAAFRTAAPRTGSS